MIRIMGALLGALVLLIVLVVSGAAGVFSAVAGGGSSPGLTALADIPGRFLALYSAAARTCPGLDWSVLAAIGKIESDHGRSQLPGVRSGANSAGARGPLQFLPTTFHSVIAKSPPPPGGHTPPSPYDPHDAIYAAAAYLCDSGARGNRDLRKAVFTYNHADWYVSDVLAQAARYRRAAADDSPRGSPAAVTAVRYALAQLGQPYVWGGNGRQDGGFDCSGLTKAAYTAAHIALPRTAAEQYQAGPRVGENEKLIPGDLVFYGHRTNGADHVGIYIGAGKMIDAPHRNASVRITAYRHHADGYMGATRPAARAPRSTV
ncbi:NlpC/P60 family protein [Streptomyces sp. NPDC059009]|uniref:C40 family peptidase n=1 Tax=Streptomyces sp. NPDC059009 TaxID=3346694 RepID=UPI00368AC751